MSSSEQIISNLTLTLLELGKKCQFFQIFSARFTRNSKTLKYFFRFALLALNSENNFSHFPLENIYTNQCILYTLLCISIQID